MGDHEMIHAATMYNNNTGTTTACNWWNTIPATVSCSTELTGFGSNSWSALAGGDMVDHPKTSRTTASSESPGSLSNSSITFQESATNQIPVSDPAMADTTPLIAGFADWNQPFLSNSTGLHGLLQEHQDMRPRTSSSYCAQQQEQQQLQFRSNQNHMNSAPLMNPSSNNLFDQQLVSSLGSELLLSSPTSYGFQPPLPRSLIEPGFQHHHQHMNQLQQSHHQTPTARFAQCTSKLPVQFTNDTPFWSPTSAGFGVAGAAEASLGIKPSSARSPSNLTMKSALEGVGDSSSIITKKANAEPAFKKPRIETPSSLPTFKVRKEKLGDRITALQQLVSPFGKTDTASVLHETIEYIKFLHDQVGALSAPYLKNGHQVQHLKSLADKSKEGGEASKRDLRGRGLCLVPISSTFAVAGEVPVDFWPPAFGASFR